jgi:hypothetical protein
MSSMRGPIASEGSMTITTITRLSPAGSAERRAPGLLTSAEADKHRSRDQLPTSSTLAPGRR